MKKRLFIKALLLTLIFSSCSTNTSNSNNTQSSESEVKVSSYNTTSSSNAVSSDNASSISYSNSSLEEPDLVNVDIISINDTHGYEYASAMDENFSLASFSYYVEQKRKLENNNVVTIANGDMFQGTAFSNLSYGLSAINALNEVGFDMMGIGNHEFDWTLDKILNYFDGDLSNGEANFPLINGNVRDRAINNERIGENNLNDNIVPYKIIEKDNIKVGLLSYIGDQTNDICANKFGTYYIDCHGNYDTSFLKVVLNDAKKVKELGADVIILNIHDGNYDGIDKLNYNQEFAKMKNDDGKYLIDAVINGHTHTKQYGEIKRTGGTLLPVVQASPNCNGFGEINLTYDKTSKKVTSVSENSYYLKDKVNIDDKNQKVQQVLDEEYAKIKDQISEIYVNSSYYASKDKVGYYISNIMRYYSSADIAMINTGGIRSTLPEGDLTIEDLYKVNPFDNSLCYVKVLGSELTSFMASNGSYYYFSSDISTFEDDKYYNLITIDYVYYSSYFKNVFKNTIEVKVDNSMCGRDLMVLDLKSKKDVGFNIYNYTPTLESHLFPTI